MRTISVDEIINNTNNKSIINSFQPKMNLARSICLQMFNRLKSTNFIFLDSKPIKKYEIYKINLEKEEVMIANKDWLITDKQNDIEVYFDKNIAFEICEICNQLNDSAINSCPEIMEMYQDEVFEKKEKIAVLKEEDEKKYKNALTEYHIVTESYIFKNLKKENRFLNNKVNDYKEIIRDLGKKLEFSMEKYEEILKQPKTGLLEGKDNIFTKLIKSIKRALK